MYHAKFEWVIKWIFLLLCYGSAIFIFQEGFLLKKTSLSYHSKCEDFPSQRGVCWNKPKYEKAILIVIDALRFDFIDPSNKIVTPYTGKLSIVGELLRKEPQNTLVSKFIADPPTTTLQRLKGLTTGSLPTFIEMANNFDASSIDEDNLIDQLVSVGKNVTFMGDDTWTSLFNGKFNKQYPAPSFDVQDLDTVDNMVLDHLFEEIQANDSTLLIGHFLGVDHCGHRFGPNNRKMSEKLSQMNEALKKVIKMIDNETLLIVLGDHGMSLKGDHGGDSENEVTAGFFAYSKKQLVYGERLLEFSQIDFVPTLSFLLGIPVPFTNIGIVIRTFFTDSELLNVLQLNAAQVIRLITAYGREDTDITTNFQTILREYNFGLDDEHDSYYHILLNVQNQLRSIWVEFDYSLMFIGILALADTILFQANYFDSSTSMAYGIFRSGILLLLLSLIAAPKTAIATECLKLVLPFSVLFLTFRLISKNVLKIYHINVNIVLFATLILVHCLSMFSNSFIINESNILSFILRLLVFILALQSILFQYTLKKTVFSNVLFMILVVSISTMVASSLHICRDEVQDCKNSFFVNTIAMSTDSQNLLKLSVGISFLFFVNYYISKSRLFRMTRLRSSFNSISYIICGCISFHWILRTFSFSQNPNMELAILYVPMFVHIVFIFFTTISLCFFDLESFSTMLFHGIILESALILGQNSGLALFCLLVLSIYFFVFIINDHTLYSFHLYFVISYGFYLFSNLPTITSIPWLAAFVGIPGNFPIIFVPQLLVIIHLFGANFIVSAFVFAKACQDNFMYKVPSTLTLLFAIKMLFICIMCVIHRRHLMVFKIFAPKFIFEGVSFISFVTMSTILAAIHYLKKRN